MERNKKNIVRAVSILLIAALLIFIFDFLTRLLMPKYMSAPIEGAFIAEYYDETLPHDVLFVGDCEVFSNISPVKLYRDYGITSFVRGSAQQLIWQSYYLVEEMLETETPKAVVFNVLALVYNEPQHEPYNRMTIDGMKLSSHKLGAIKASMTADESMIDYIFPLLRYHSRWSELTSDDFKYLYSRDKVTHNGYYMRLDTRPGTEITPGIPRTFKFGDNTMSYLDRMRELCEEKGVELILMKAPSLSMKPYWFEQYNDQVVEYAEKHDLLYINMLENIEEVGVDFETDTFDAGIHLNLYGAEKVSSYIGKILKEHLSLSDHRGDAEYDKVWEEKCNFYDEMIEAQKKELSEFGHLVNFGAAISGE